MASFEQIIKFENEKPNGVVRLVEANGFYRAYNHSAYLFHQAIARHKVTRKFVKNINQELVYIGFPVDKLLERIGTRSHKKTEHGYDVELLADELPSDEKYDEWRGTVPTEATSRGDANSLPLHGDELCRSVCEKIRFFRTYVASHTLKRIRNHLHSVSSRMSMKRAQAVVNSSLGVLSHYDSYLVREVMTYKSGLSEFGRFSDDGLRFYPDALSWWLFQIRGSYKTLVNSVGRSPRERRGHAGRVTLPVRTARGAVPAESTDYLKNNGGI